MNQVRSSVRYARKREVAAGRLRCCKDRCRATTDAAAAAVPRALELLLLLPSCCCSCWGPWFSLLSWSVGVFGGLDLSVHSAAVPCDRWMITGPIPLILCGIQAYQAYQADSRRESRDSGNVERLTLTAQVAFIKSTRIPYRVLAQGRMGEPRRKTLKCHSEEDAATFNGGVEKLGMIGRWVVLVCNPKHTKSQ